MSAPPRVARILFLGAPASPHAAAWIRHLRARGHDVHVGTIHEVPAWAEGFTTRLRSGRDVARPGALSDLPAAVRGLRALLARFRPELTIAYYLTSYGLLAALARAPRVVGATAGGDVLVHPFYARHKRLRQRLILGLALPRARRILAWSPHVADRLRSLGVPSDRIAVQVRGIDLDRFRPPAPNGSGADALSIVSLRWFKKLYDLPTLLRALGALSKGNLAFRAVLAGEGPERARLEGLARELGIADRVRFAGKVAAEDVPGLLGSGDVYVSTSSTDGASSSLFEAMAMGLYPVVTDIPANRPWIRHGVNGHLFAVGDHVGLAEGIRAAAGDPGLRRSARARNAEIVRNELDFGENMRRIEEVVLSVLED